MRAAIVHIEHCGHFVSGAGRKKCRFELVDRELAS